MTHHLRRIAALAVLVAAATGAALAQPAASSADRRFVDQAAAGGAAEVALGRLAGQQASRDDVKQFGQQMVDDHGKTNAELKQLAGGKGMTPPEAPTPAQQKVAERLARLQGDAFDRMFLNQMALDHKQTIGLFRREARGGSDADLKAFAAKTLPELEGHLRMVRELQTKGGPMNRVVNERK